MKERCLDFFACPACGGHLHLPFALLRVDGEVKEGVMACLKCTRPFPIVDFIPIISANSALFAKPLRFLLTNWRHVSGLKKFFSVLSEPQLNRQELMQTQLDHFAAEAERYDEEITQSPFWQAVQDLTVIPWSQAVMARGGEVLEIGCGTGRSTVMLVKAGCRVIATDLCLEVIRLARERILQKDAELKSIDFTVCEAETLPFQSPRFNSCVFTGVLHHVVEPKLVLSEISRVILPGAQIFGYENNASAFRFLFDFLMKFKRLWHEEAGPQPLLEGAMVRDWANECALDIRTSSAFFLPPHFFTQTLVDRTRKILDLSNRFFMAWPWFRDQGGLLIIEGTKRRMAQPISNEQTASSQERA